MGLFNWGKKNREKKEAQETLENQVQGKIEEQGQAVGAAEPESAEEAVAVPEAEPEALETSEGMEEAETMDETAVEPEPAEEIQEKVAEEAPKKQGFFAKLTAGLKKTRDNVGGLFEQIFSGSAIDEDFYEELEEGLIVADVGMETTSEILTKLRARVKEEKLTEPGQAREALRDIVVELMQPDASFIGDEKAVILIVGVNGVGKTTSIGKLAASYKAQGKKVMLAAADTFRAAATEQLVEWANRADVPIVKHQEGADPAAVVYDAIQSAKAKDMDLLIADTAGRLHNKKNLMEELRKIRRIIDREYPDARVETLLVLDATTGQNGLAQARVFAETVDLTGIILSKLDGTAKGGVAVAVKSQSGLPVRFVGVGEKIDDLQPFDPQDYVNALF